MLSDRGPFFQDIPGFGTTRWHCRIRYEIEHAITSMLANLEDTENTPSAGASVASPPAADGTEAGPRLI